MRSSEVCDINKRSAIMTPIIVNLILLLKILFRACLTTELPSLLLSLMVFVNWFFEVLPKFINILKVIVKD